VKQSDLFTSTSLPLRGSPYSSIVRKGAVYHSERFVAASCNGTWNQCVSSRGCWCFAVIADAKWDKDLIRHPKAICHRRLGKGGLLDLE